MEKQLKCNAKKLAGSELVEFAKQTGSNTLSVIVETPTNDQVDFADPASDGDLRPNILLPIDEQEEQRQLDRLEAKLNKLINRKLVRLEAARAFVVDVTPKQLQTISSFDEVGIVRLNRTHHLPAKLDASEE